MVKVRDVNGMLRDVEIPDGCRVVRTGFVMAGDRYLDVVKLSKKIIDWVPICDDIGELAGDYRLLIRDKDREWSSFNR